MEDPGVAWPYWKFGLGRDDLFTKLHDQYNTIPSAIQDPEAFHHDVFEISCKADTTDEFYRLLSTRKQQRIRELNDSLESASLEIIGNPSLIGTEQWQYALQLFRTRSLDSLVRYFASYIPEDHPWHRVDYSCGSEAGGSSSDSVDSLANSDISSFFDDRDDGPIMTDEPLPLEEEEEDISVSNAMQFEHKLTPSRRSTTMCSLDSSAASSIGLDRAYLPDTFTPTDSASFSESEPETDSHMVLQDSVLGLHDGQTLQPCEADSSITSVSDMPDVSESASYDDASTEQRAAEAVMVVERTEDKNSMHTDAELESETTTPTPRPHQQPAVCFFDAKLSLPRQRYRSLSPSRPHPLSPVNSPSAECRDAIRSCRFAPRGLSPVALRKRKLDESAVHVQKASHETIRAGSRRRRRVD